MNILIKNVRTLVFEPMANNIICDIYISDGLITALDAKRKGNPDFVPERTIDGANLYAIPGLINSHTHLYMSVLRNYADDLPFDEWLFGRIMPKEDLLSEEDAYWCNMLSCMEMIQSGTSCYLDMHMFREQSIRAAQDAGMRAVMSRGIVGESADDDAGLTRLEDALFELELAEGRGDLLSCMLGPHAIYTCGEGLLRHLAAVAKEKNMRINIHLSETEKEVADCIEAHGCSPVEYLAGLGVFDVPTIAAHCAHVSDNDIALLKKHKVSVATNPVSNMKLGNGFAPVPKMLHAGVNVCLGTDSAASNNSLNMFREMSILSYIHKGVHKDPVVVDAETVVRCATINGAAALGLDGQIGSLAVGKRADIALLDLRKPQMQPVNNPLASLVYSANGSEVDTMIIDGNVVMAGGVLETIDAERVYYEISQIQKQLL